MSVVPGQLGLGPVAEPRVTRAVVESVLAVDQCTEDVTVVAGDHVELDALRAGPRCIRRSGCSRRTLRRRAGRPWGDARLRRSAWPWGRSPRWVIFAPRNSAAEPLGQAATHAPQPMQVAASNAVSARVLGTGTACASGAAPVGAVMYPPAAMIRSNPPRSTMRSLITGNGAARHGSTSIMSPSAKLPHVQLTGRDQCLRPVRDSIDDQPALPRRCLRGSRCRTRSDPRLRG